MKTKEYLSQIKVLDRMINNKLSELSQLKEMSYGLSAIPSGEKVQTSQNHDKIGTLVAKIVDMETEIDVLVDKYVDLKKEIYIKMNLLRSEKHKKILYKKYVECKSIYTIAEELGMTDRGCKKAHKRALEEMEKIRENTIYSISIDSSPQHMV